jgi:cytochrome P450
LQFLPDRWDTLKLEDPFMFLPFSGGSRNCIGQHLGLVEIKIIIALFLRNFDFELNPRKKLILG